MHARARTHTHTPVCYSVDQKGVSRYRLLHVSHAHMVATPISQSGGEIGNCVHISVHTLVDITKWVKCLKTGLISHLAPPLCFSCCLLSITLRTTLSLNSFFYEYVRICLVCVCAWFLSTCTYLVTVWLLCLCVFVCECVLQKRGRTRPKKGRMLTYADVCWRMLTKFSECGSENEDEPGQKKGKSAGCGMYF